MNDAAGQRDSKPIHTPRTNATAARLGPGPAEFGGGPLIAIGGEAPGQNEGLVSGLPDADRYAHMELQLACPKCGSAGLIPWRQLDRQLFCHGCQSHYRVEPGRLVELETSQEIRVQVQVRTNSSRWTEHQVRIAKPRTRLMRLCDAAIDFLLYGRARWAVAGAAMLLCVVGITAAGGKPAPPVEIEIPLALEDRAVLLAEAAARRDMSVLVRLTDPAEHRALRIWLAHGLEIPQPAASDASPAKVKAELVGPALLTAVGDRAEVKVRLSGGPDDKSVLLAEQWIQRGQTWYFQPVRLRTPAQPVRLHSPRQPQRRAR